MFDLGSIVIGTFNTPGVALKRRSTPTYTNGFASTSSVSTSTLSCSWHPVSGNELQALPEGQRTPGAIYIYTINALQSANSATGQLADVVTINSINYEIHETDNWSIQGNFYRYLGIRLPT